MHDSEWIAREEVRQYGQGRVDDQGTCRHESCPFLGSESARLKTQRGDARRQAGVPELAGNERSHREGAHAAPAVPQLACDDKVGVRPVTGVQQGRTE
jgi:hypothetical protein